MKSILKTVLSIAIILLVFNAKSNDTTRYVFYFGASNTNINQDLNSKIKNYGNYELKNNMFSVGLSYKSKWTNDFGYVFYFNNSDYTNEVNKFTTSYVNSSIYFGFYYDFIESYKYDFNISTMFGYTNEIFKFKDSRNITTLDSLFSFSSESTINKQSYNYMTSAEFVYNFKFGLGLSIMANYSGQFIAGGYYFKDTDTEFEDLKKFRSIFFDLQLGISYRF